MLESNDEKPNCFHFTCTKCRYVANNKRSWVRHISTLKHLSDYDLYPFECKDCGKKYKDASGLWRHSKLCTASPEITNDVSKLTEIIIKQCKIIEAQSHEISAQSHDITELTKLTIANAGNNNNSNNTHFNLQFFLNETCKDALNLKDFVKSIIIELTDLKKTEAVGYVDGMSSIIVGALDSLDVNKRPIHCSDLKRETMYIKEDDVWEKEDDNMTNMKDMIRSVEHKTIMKLPDWVKANPTCVKGDHKDNTTYLKMIAQVTGGDIEKGKENVDKIIHKIAQNVIIKKNA